MKQMRFGKYMIEVSDDLTIVPSEDESKVIILDNEMLDVYGMLILKGEQVNIVPRMLKFTIKNDSISLFSN